MYLFIQPSINTATLVRSCLSLSVVGDRLGVSRDRGTKWQTTKSGYIATTVESSFRPRWATTTHQSRFAEIVSRQRPLLWLWNSLATKSGNSLVKQNERQSKVNLLYSIRHKFWAKISHHAFLIFNHANYQAYTARRKATRENA